MTEYDLTIIGGGIAGAGVAQAATAAGYKVLLLEKGEFARQTSTSSSKLIHGGLRYLESGQINLVYSALNERKALLRLAPELVKPVPFYIPVYKNSARGVWTLRAGLSLYALLSGFTLLGRFKQVSKKYWSVIHGLNTENLVAVFQYWDAQTDDRKLTLSVIKSAQQLGANVCQFSELISAKKRTKGGYQICYQQNDENIVVNSKMVVNAAGPWVNKVLTTINSEIPKCDIDWVQGAHIILNKAAPKKVYYLESKSDQRVVFVMPWYGKTLVGTTETVLDKLPDNITATDKEINYLLDIYTYYFKLENPEVISSFAGVRVLPRGGSKAFSRPRESIIYQDLNNLDVISLYGGKLTTFRATAKKVVKLIEKQLGQKTDIADINQLPLLMPDYD